MESGPSFEVNKIGKLHSFQKYVYCFSFRADLYKFKWALRLTLWLSFLPDGYGQSAEIKAYLRNSEGLGMLPCKQPLCYPKYGP